MGVNLGGRATNFIKSTVSPTSNVKRHNLAKATREQSMFKDLHKYHTNKAKSLAKKDPAMSEKHTRLAARATQKHDHIDNVVRPRVMAGGTYYKHSRLVGGAAVGTGLAGYNMHVHHSLNPNRAAYSLTKTR